MHNKIVAVVGLAGSGKTECTRFLEMNGLHAVRFGDITDQLLQENALEQNEANERRMREFIRQKEGMHAYAKLSLPKIEFALEKGDVVIDGLYSWDEYKFLKNIFGEHLILLAVYSPPETRYARLSQRLLRPLFKKEAESRDIAEIEHLQKAGPIAIADYTIINTGNLDELREEINKFAKLFL